MIISNKIPSLLEIDHDRLAQIILNLVCLFVKTMKKDGSIKILIDYFPNCNHISQQSYEPIPFADDGFFEKDLNVTYLNSTYTTYFPHHNINHKSSQNSF